MVYRIYVEKKAGLDNEARALLSEIKTFLGIDSIERVRIINRYDAENITAELFDYAVGTVFSEPQLDEVYKNVENDGAVVFATEYLPGQFDQRADSAAQCIQLISQGDKPTVASARVYMLYGKVSAEDIERIKNEYPQIAFFIVRGNCDFMAGDYENEKIITLGSNRVLICHGHTLSVKSTLVRATLRAVELECDALFFGHTHMPEDNVLDVMDKQIHVFNPGSIGYHGNYGVVNTSGNVLVTNHGKMS